VSRDRDLERDLDLDLTTVAVGCARGEEIGPTETRSVRMPARVWCAIERAAARQHVSVHALLRAAISRIAP
jgi:hypothetical protein